MTLANPEPIPDEVLVLDAQNGRGDAREELARRYRRPAFLFALQLLGNREDALDVAQDAMLRFFRTLARFEPRRPVQPWLFRIVRNRAVDVARRRAIRQAESLDDPDRAHDPPARPDLDPERLAERRELQARIWEVLHRLPEKQREILVLRDYQDLTYAEISTVLRIPKGTVMSRLHGARKALRAAVAERLGGTHD